MKNICLICTQTIPDRESICENCREKLDQIGPTQVRKITERTKVNKERALEKANAEIAELKYRLDRAKRRKKELKRVQI